MVNGVIIIFAIISVSYINFFTNIQNNAIYLSYVILITIMLLWSLKNILVSVKNKKQLDFDEAKESFNLMPFGPAMIFSATLCLFYLEQIKIAIKMFLY